MADRLIEAAGGVLWRPAVGGSGIELALVHRPKYDDWSLPKGKLMPGEHPVVAAVREVWEETGHTGVPGRPLGELRYVKDSTPKRVRYWAMEAVAGSFHVNDEVDQVMWLPPREARSHLGPDRGIAARLDHAAVSTQAFVLVRHGSAGDRSTWQGDDRDRPLDDTGEAQSHALVPLLSVYHLRRVLSADVLRCLETVGPFAERSRLPVVSEPLLSETGYGSNPDLAVERLVDIVGADPPAVVCSQGKAIPGLVNGLCAAMGARPPADPSIRKGGLMVVHVSRPAGAGADLVGLERFAPPL